MQTRTSESQHFSCFSGKIPFHQQKTPGPMMLLLNHGRPGLVRLQDSLTSGMFYHLSYIDLTNNNRCGNGLLTHILTSEGYQGFGIDVRARTSWDHYPRSTQASLKVHAFNPTVDDRVYFKPGVFVIGNHADEMTPWLPVVSTLYDASGYISIPCCQWAFDAKYDRSHTPLYPLPDVDFANTLNLGGDGSHKSSYSMYRIWLASLSLHCGWQVECEMLRIPSTRNWAIVGELLRFLHQGYLT